VKDPARAGKIIAVSSLWEPSPASGFDHSVLDGPWLATHTLADPHLVVPLRIGTLALFLSSINAAQGGALYGFRSLSRDGEVAGDCRHFGCPLHGRRLLSGRLEWHYRRHGGVQVRELASDVLRREARSAAS